MYPLTRRMFAMSSFFLCSWTQPHAWCGDAGWQGASELLKVSSKAARKHVTLRLLFFFWSIFIMNVAQGNCISQPHFQTDNLRMLRSVAAGLVYHAVRQDQCCGESSCIMSGLVWAILRTAGHLRITSTSCPLTRSCSYSRAHGKCTATGSSVANCSKNSIFSL